jgi:CRP-like cAMP-binding protein
MMPKTVSLQDACMNSLLARLPLSDLQTVLPHLESTTLPVSTVIYDALGKITYTYFPVTAVLSFLRILKDGTAIEVATVGKEGMTGYSVTPAGLISTNRVIAQIEGLALRMNVRNFSQLLLSSQALRELQEKYSSAFMAQVSQSVACNGLHTIEQRCCRWLLMSRDRVGMDSIGLTHEFLSYMLGVRRASVSETLQPLQEAGLLTSRRGKIVLLDVPGLKSRACECYQAVKDEYDRLFATS